jgi:predicted dehydrogenase
MAAGATLTLVPWAAVGQTGASQSANGAVRLGLIGLGGLNVPGSVGGRGRQLMNTIRKIPEARIVALCDVDDAVLDHGMRQCQDRGETVARFKDIRKLLEDQSVDAVIVATPNHWHALATIWACQAGKDVYCEKPFCYNIWEGRQMVSAARKHGRMVQVGTQNRSSSVLREAFELLRAGQLGAVRSAHALVYRPRESLGSVSPPTSIPETVDYDLWCGPSPKGPLMRKHLHYEWHWFWDTGNGEMGNNGIHVIDICRWGLSTIFGQGYAEEPPRTLSMGGRFAFNDCGQTANTQVACFDYKPAPIICEVRNVHALSVDDKQSQYRRRNGGIVIDCEGGYLAGEGTGVALLDRAGATIKELKLPKSADLEVTHMTAFLKAVRSRKREDLAAEALEGHLSTACCHLANISHRVGHQMPTEEIMNRAKSQAELSDGIERCKEHLRANGVDLDATPPVLGPWLDFDQEHERFVGEFASKANALLRRDYRKPFVVPAV